MFHVKHFLEKAVKSIGLEPDNQKLGELDFYIDELLRWNERINLVGGFDKEKLVKTLILPSLIPAIHLERNVNVLDFGAGGGVVGIPLKVFRSDIHIDFLERREKKCVFLRYITNSLNIDANIICGNYTGREELNMVYDYAIFRGVKIEKGFKNIAKYLLYFGQSITDFEICEEWRYKTWVITKLKGATDNSNS